MALLVRGDAAALRSKCCRGRGNVRHADRLVSQTRRLADRARSEGLVGGPWCPDLRR